MRMSKRVERLEETIGANDRTDEPPLLIIRGIVAPSEEGPQRTGAMFAYLPGGRTLTKNEDESEQAFEARAREAMAATQNAQVEQRTAKR